MTLEQPAPGRPLRCSVREARVADAPAIARVHVESWRTTYRGLVPDQVLERLSCEQRERHWAESLRAAGRPEFVYVAEDRSGRVVGFASGGPERGCDPAYRGELYAIYLLRAQQRRGLGRRLVRAVAERLARAGIRSMLVWVLAANPACRFYEALGGRPVGRKRIQLGGAALEEIAYGWEDTGILLSPGE